MIIKIVKFHSSVLASAFEDFYELDMCKFFFILKEFFMNQNQMKSFMGFLEGNILLEKLNIRMSWLSITMEVHDWTHHMMYKNWKCWFLIIC